jgi:hypothetical protein
MVLGPNNRYPAAVCSVPFRRRSPSLGRPHRRSDGEDRTQGIIDVGIRGAVERIEQDEIRSALPVRYQHRLFHFLRGEGPYDPAPLQRLNERIVGDVIQFLHGFTLDVRLAGRPEDIEQPGDPQVSREDFSDQSDMRQEDNKGVPVSRHCHIASIEVLFEGVKTKGHELAGFGYETPCIMAADRGTRGSRIKLYE